MVILTDDQQDPRMIPTRANIIAAMQWLVNDAQDNDSYVFYFNVLFYLFFYGLIITYSFWFYCIDSFSTTVATVVT